MMPQENTAVMILFMKHRMQIMQYISKYHITTDSTKCIWQTVSSLFASDNYQHCC